MSRKVFGIGCLLALAIGSRATAQQPSEPKGSVWTLVPKHEAGPEGRPPITSDATNPVRPEPSNEQYVKRNPDGELSLLYSDSPDPLGTPVDADILQKPRLQRRTDLIADHAPNGNVVLSASAEQLPLGVLISELQALTVNQQIEPEQRQVLKQAMTVLDDINRKFFPSRQPSADPRTAGSKAEPTELRRETTLEGTAVVVKAEPGSSRTESSFTVTAAGNVAILLEPSTGKTWRLANGVDETVWLPITKRLESAEQRDKWIEEDSEKRQSRK
jgi:hypothetical protein